MAPIKITVEGVGGVKLSTDAELDKWLAMKQAQCLIGSDGYQVIGFASLEDGGTYTLGPQQQHQAAPRTVSQSNLSTIRGRRWLHWR